MTNEDMVVKMAEVEHRSSSNTRRIEKLELQTEAIQELATSVRVMATQFEHQTDSIRRIEETVANVDSKMDAKVGELDVKIDTEVGKLDNRLGVVEHKPAKKLEDFVGKAVWYIAAALLGFLLSQIGIS